MPRSSNALAQAVCLFMLNAAVACSAGGDMASVALGAPGAGGSSGSNGANGALGSGAEAGSFYPVEGGPPGNEGSVGNPNASPCAALGCGPGQRCASSAAGVACLDNDCAALGCAATETCRPDPGGGNVCANLFCALDVDCRASDFCSSEGSCQPDVCGAGQSSCQADGVLVCASNGARQDVPFTCGSPSYFATACEESMAGQAACSCEDDWDCPAFTRCEVDRCVGTGRAPACTLPPSSFANTAPRVARTPTAMPPPFAAPRRGAASACTTAGSTRATIALAAPRLRACSTSTAMARPRYSITTNASFACLTA